MAINLRILIVIAAIEVIRVPVFAAQISWIGSNGSWQDAANWNTGKVPGRTDDVVIDVPSAVTVTYNGTSTVRSLDSKETLQQLGGSLEVLAASTISGPLQLNNATLGATGAQLISSGTVSSINGWLFANSGGQTRLPGLTAYTANASGQRHWAVGWPRQRRDR
jgi:hypothetical protein